jgi:hypothetical protein
MTWITRSRPASRPVSVAPEAGPGWPELPKLGDETPAPLTAAGPPLDARLAVAASDRKGLMGRPEAANCRGGSEMTLAAKGMVTRSPSPLAAEGMGGELGEGLGPVLPLAGGYGLAPSGCAGPAAGTARDGGAVHVGALFELGPGIAAGTAFGGCPREGAVGGVNPQGRPPVSWPCPVVEVCPRPVAEDRGGARGCGDPPSRGFCA